MREWPAVATEPPFPLDESIKAKADTARTLLGSSLNPRMDALFESEGFPARLCHYTDFAGLKGILESGQLWATYGKTLNDSSELVYGREVLTEYLRHKACSEAHPLIEAALNDTRRNFVTCFCESSRVLSMWRGYSAFGGGYCLEFDGHGLLGGAFPPHSVCLRFKMTYGTDLSEPLQSVLDSICEFAGRGQIEAIVSGSSLSVLALKFKHPAFAEEREWRLVIQEPEISFLKFRAGHANIKPYIELRHAAKDGSKLLPLQKVVYGPTLRGDEVLVETIQMILEQNGYRDVAIESSDIPYRL
jgi:hypothetical protein